MKDRKKMKLKYKIKRSLFRNYGFQFLIFIVPYLLGIFLAVKLQSLDRMALSVWPLAGIALGVILLFRIRVFPIVVIYFSAISICLFMFIFFGIGNGKLDFTTKIIPLLAEILQTVFAVKSLNYFQFERHLNRVSNVFKLISLGAIACTIKPTLMISMACLLQEGEWSYLACISPDGNWSKVIHIFWKLWLANFMGILIFTPLILSFSSLIFMDMRMPVMDGYEATKQIKSTTKGNATAVIAVTASVLEEESAIVLSSGCDDFIRKPFTEQQIFETLAKHLGVNYIYAETKFSTPDIPQDNALTSQHLTCMSQDWIMRLYEATLEANSQPVMQLIAEIPSQESYLIKSLTQLVNQFQFEQLLDLAEPLVIHDE